MTTIDLEGRFYKLSPAGAFDGLQPIPLAVDLEHAALLVVDVYGLGFTPDEGSARHHPSVDDAAQSPWEAIASDAIQPALEAARRIGMPVVYAHNSGPRIELNRSQIGRQLNRTLDTDLEELFREKGVDGREYLTGTDNLFLETSKLVGPKDGDYFIRKHQYSGFRDTRLDTLLRNLGVTTLFCVGFDAATCLKMTMVDAFELELRADPAARCHGLHRDPRGRRSRLLVHRADHLVDGGAHLRVHHLGPVRLRVG